MTTSYMIPLIGKVQNKEIHRKRRQMSGCQDVEGAGNGEWLITGVGFLWG